jgi:hypothetical protein
MREVCADIDFGGLMPASKVLQFLPPTHGSRTNNAYRIVDGRSTEGRLLRRMRDQLLGGLPPHSISPLAAALAERCSFVQLNLLKLDQVALTQRRGLSPSQSRLYGSLSTQHSRLVAQLAKLTQAVQAPPGAELDAYLGSYESSEVSEGAAA